MLEISTPGRIHCCLINESGFMGRIDGSLGISISIPQWKIEIIENDVNLICGDINNELKSAALALLVKMDINFKTGKWIVNVREKIESHIGLGSKTSFLLSIAYTILQSKQCKFDIENLAALVGRGGTSGIGVNNFLSGGISIDIGRRYPEQKSDFLPSSFTNSNFPKVMFNDKTLDWKILMIRLSDVKYSGIKEKEIFVKNCPVPHSDTIHIGNVVFYIILPSIIEKNITAFNQGLLELQRVGFKKIEWDLQAAGVHYFKKKWEKEFSNICLGLSSFGPTMYCVVNTEMEDKIKNHPFIKDKINILSTSINNTGAIIKSI